MTLYAFDTQLVLDANGEHVVLDDALVTIYDPSDTGLVSPLALVDNTGTPLPNPLLASSQGFLPAFQATVPQVMWALAEGGVFGYLNSFKGFMDALPPTGGSTGQVLSKNSNADHDTVWVDAPVGTGGGGGTVDTSGLVPKHWTIDTAGSELSYRSLDLNYMPGTTSPDTSQITVQGVVTQWFNEWGGMRGTPTSAFKDDSLVRGVRRTDLGAGSTGNFIEYEDRTYATTDPRRKPWGVRWRDGVINRNGVDMALCYVRYGATTLPTYLPDGTVIVTVND